MLRKPYVFYTELLCLIGHRKKNLHEKEQNTGIELKQSENGSYN